MNSSESAPVAAPAPHSAITRHIVSLVVGLCVGVFFHYLLFRLTLPVQPFIYVAF